MKRADIVFELIARKIGMERSEKLRDWMELYADAREADAREETAEPGESSERLDQPQSPEPAVEPETDTDKSNAAEAGRTQEPGRPPDGRDAVRPDVGAGYTGFLHLRCPKCGEVKTFCSKSPLREYRCGACGSVTPLEGLLEARLNCECGNRSKYLTNRT